MMAQIKVFSQVVIFIVKDIRKSRVGTESTFEMIPIQMFQELVLIEVKSLTEIAIRMWVDFYISWSFTTDIPF